MFLNIFLIESNIRDIFMMLLFVAGGVIIFSGIGILFLYRTKKGRFNKEYKQKVTDDIIEVTEEMVKIEEDQRTKDEIMADLYQDYYDGKITESELNARLRSLWWIDND